MSDAPSLHRTRAAGVAVLCVLVFFIVRSMGDSEDLGGYVLVGRLVLEGQHPYDDAPPGINTWPPVFGLLCVPLALLDDVSVWLVRGAWLLLVGATLLLALREIAALVHHRRLGLTAGLPLGSAALVVPLAICHAPVFGNFLHLQINTVVLALVLIALRWDARGAPVRGGLLLGAVAAVRVMPVAFVPYLLWRGRWRTAAASLCAVLVVSLLPVLVQGPAGFAELAGRWWEIVSSGAWGVGKMNQSMPAAWDRLLGHGVVPFVTDPAVSLAPSGAAVVRVAVLATMALTALLALLLFRGRAAADGPVALTEWSIVLLVAAAYGPVCWKAYLVVALLPLALLWHLARDPAATPDVRRVAAWTLALGGGLLAVPSRDVWGRWIGGSLELASIYTLATLVLIGGLFLLRVRLARS